MQALQRPRRRLGEPAPAVDRPLAAETLLQVGRVRRTLVAHEGQHLGGKLARHLPAPRGLRIARMQQPVGFARHEAVGVEEILLQPEPAEAAFQVARPIAGHTMPQDQILRARRRPDRIGLHEARRADRPRQRRRRRQRTEHRLTAQSLDGEFAGHPIQRAGQYLVYALGRPAQAHAARSDHHRPLHQDRMRQDRADQLLVRLGLVIQAHGVVRRATPPQQLASRYVHAPQHAEKFLPGGRHLQVFDHLWLDTCLADHAQHLA